MFRNEEKTIKLRYLITLQFSIPSSAGAKVQQCIHIAFTTDAELYISRGELHLNGFNKVS